MPPAHGVQRTWLLAVAKTRLKKLALKAKQKEARKLSQTKLVTDSTTHTIHLSKKLNVLVISPDQKHSSLKDPPPSSNVNGKRPAPSSSSSKVAKYVPKKCFVSAKPYLCGELKETRITYHFPIKAKDDLISNKVALAMISNLFQQYHATNDTIAILHWHKKNFSTVSPLVDPPAVLLMEVAKF